MSVHKDERKKGNWVVVYQNKKKRGFTSKREAEAYEAKLKLGVINNSPDQKVYFHVVAKDYLENLKENTSYGTYSKARNVIENVVIPNTANKLIDKVTAIDCRNFRSYIDKQDYSTFYKNYILNKYKAIFKHAQEFFGLKDNPTSFLKNFKKTYDESKKYKEKEMQIWTIEEFETFISCVKREDYKALFTTIFFTGMRLGECLALTYEDITEDQMIHINKNITRKTTKGTYEVKEPKTSSSIRDIPTGNNLYKYLMDFKEKEKKVPGFREDWFIFGRDKPFPQTSIDHVKDRAIEKAGVKRITIHQMRHSHASYLINNGVNIVAVSKRLGHADVSMTLDVYTHLFKNVDQQLIDFIDDKSKDFFGGNNDD